LDSNDLAEISRFYNGYQFEVYNLRPSIADISKLNLDDAEVSKHPLDYIFMYVSIGVKSPKEFTEAFLMQNYGLWYPSKSYPDTRMYHPFAEYQMLDAKLWNTKYQDIKTQIVEQIYLDSTINLPA
jgi:hypothetical protein